MSDIPQVVLDALKEGAVSIVPGAPPGWLRLIGVSRTFDWNAETGETRNPFVSWRRADVSKLTCRDEQADA